MIDSLMTADGGILAIMAVIAIVILALTRNAQYGASISHTMSVRARLPFGSEAVALSVRRRNRALVRGNMWGLLVTVVIGGAILALTPLALTTQVLWIVLLIIVLGGLTTSYLIVGVRERLFAPAPTAVRIARAHPMYVRDYLGPWRRITPNVLLIAAIAAIAALVMVTAGEPIDAAASPIVYVSFGLGVAVWIATRIAERAVLAQPQPASNTLELAWDDLFRTDTLSALRMAAATALWIPFGLAASLHATQWPIAVSPEIMSIVGMLPWIGVPTLQVLYTLAQNRLPAALYPDFLAMPGFAPEGEPA